MYLMDDEVLDKIDEIISNSRGSKLVKLTANEFKILEGVWITFQKDGIFYHEDASLLNASAGWMRFLKQLVELAILCSSHTKALHILEKITSKCSSLDSDGVIFAIKENLIHTKEILKWSPILDVSNTWRTALKSHFPGFLIKLEEEMNGEMTRSWGEQQSLLTCVKLCLQVLNFYQSEFKEINFNHVTSSEFGACFAKLMQYLIDILSDAVYTPGDVHLLAGSAVGHFLNTLPVEQGINFYLNFDHSLGYNFIRRHSKFAI
ncbi:uncharacterized protein LOC141898817 [Tubulanus polymorphus]|uniref:uncharacterized protein LOC141898817 n=1 Tax=Tubulanus polymorphus TaxID=672921 RepID=UPI003DA429CB